MPAQKRPRDSSTSPPPHPTLEVERLDDSYQGWENRELKKQDKSSDSEGSSCCSYGENNELIVVKLAEVRKEVQCPICLGIIRKTRTVMECLHRFCRECIDKSMRLGNNECPACRTHCASRRSLRDDPNYDALIAALYPDIDMYEEEELTFHEEEKARNKKIQAFISETFRRQAEALGKKRTPTRATAAICSRRQANCRKSRSRRNQRAVEFNESDEEEEANGQEGSKDSSSSDEHSLEARSEHYKGSGCLRTSKSLLGVNADGGGGGEAFEASTALIESSKFLVWGRGGTRSNTRHGGLSWVNGRILRHSRLSKLINRIQCSYENDDELKISLKLISSNEENIPSLKRPYLCCSATSLVGHLCQYVALQTSVGASEIEMLIVKDLHPVNVYKIFREQSSIFDPSRNELQPLNEHDTLGKIRTRYSGSFLVLAYQRTAKIEHLQGMNELCENWFTKPQGVKLVPRAEKEL